MRHEEVSHMIWIRIILTLLIAALTYRACEQCPTKRREPSMTALELIAEAHGDLKALARVRDLEPSFNPSGTISRIQAKLMSACQMMDRREEHPAQQRTLIPASGEEREKKTCPVNATP